MDKEAKPKRSRWGRGCLILLAVLFGVVLLGAIVDPEKHSGAASPAPQVHPAPPLQVSAKALAKAYEANEAAAQQTFGGRVLQVKAQVQDIQLGLGDKPFLVLVGTNRFLGPQATLDESSQSMAATLSKGQDVILTCTSVSEVIGTPMLSDCHID